MLHMRYDIMMYGTYAQFLLATDLHDIVEVQLHPDSFSSAPRGRCRRCIYHGTRSPLKLKNWPDFSGVSDATTLNMPSTPTDTGCIAFGPPMSDVQLWSEPGHRPPQKVESSPVSSHPGHMEIAVMSGRDLACLYVWKGRVSFPSR